MSCKPYTNKKKKKKISVEDNLRKQASLITLQKWKDLAKSSYTYRVRNASYVLYSMRVCYELTYPLMMTVILSMETLSHCRECLTEHWHCQRLICSCFEYWQLRSHHHLCSADSRPVTTLSQSGFAQWKGTARLVLEPSRRVKCRAELWYKACLILGDCGM